MKMEAKIARSNMKYHRNKNILIGMAILLTSLLLFMVPTIGMDIINAQFAAVNEIYPSWYGVFRNVEEATAHKLSNHHAVADYGLRSDLGRIVNDTSDITLTYLDEKAFSLYRLTLAEGRLPEKEEDIVVSRGMLYSLRKDASAPGDTIILPYQVLENGGLGYQKEQEFVICGILEEGEEAAGEQSAFTAFISKALLQRELQGEQLKYRFLFQTVSDRRTNTEEIKEQMQQLANQFQIAEDDIGINEEYLSANYYDPAIVSAIVAIMLIIVLAGIITIYSIYYVNMPERIQEFGRLKAIGATKGQLRKIVLLEGLGVTAIALPLGLLLGSILTRLILTGMFRLYSNENIIMSTIVEIMEQGRITFFSPWMYLLTAVVTISTVCLSLLKPMSIAAGISEIDALRYEATAGAKGNGKIRNGKKRTRKSFREISILRLSHIYLLGNRKKSLITIISMSITGIFIMIIATVLSCANPRESANSSIWGQYQMLIRVEQGNKEHPEKEWHQVIFNNPLTEELKARIEQIPGVTGVSCMNAALASSDTFSDEQYYLGGIPKEYEKTLIDGIVEGSITYEELENSDKIIVDKNLLNWYPDIRIGDIIVLDVADGTNQNTVRMEVAAIGDYPIGFSNYNYLLTTYNRVSRISEGNLNQSYIISADKDYDEETYRNLRSLMGEEDLLGMNTWKQHYDIWKSGIAVTAAGCYSFLGIMAAICVMNMINTMINSVHIRKKEIGVMQAIGMTERQLVRMLQQEGMFYTMGTLLLSVGLGSLAGYPIYLWAKWNMIFNISAYHYPWQAGILITVVLILLQTFLAIALGKSVKRVSVIDRIRFNE